MRIEIRHRTLYRFDAPIRWIVQSQRLTPADSAGQRVIDWRVTCPGAAFGASFVDGAGDRLTTMTVAGPVDQIDVTVEGSVETADTAGVLRDHRETIAPRVYLVSTAATNANAGLREIAAGARDAIGATDELALAHALSGAVSDAIAYRPGATDAHTTAAEALAQGEGVCQDHAHALISVAHAAGLPARYVAGYLLASGEGAAEEASHAWAEIHVAGLGWVGFDPSNRCCPDARYVRLGSGRDAAEAAPIRGVSRGAAFERLDVTVSVQRGSSQTQSQQ